VRPLAVLDLDGPLLDVSARYFAAHERALRAAGDSGRPPSREEYWQAKRAGAGAESLVARAGAAGAYAAAFKACVEDDELLALDAVRPDAHEGLAALEEVADVVVLSLRTNAEGARRTLVRLRLAVPAVFVPHGPSGKTAAARRVCAGRDVAAVVGDSEADAAAAVAVGAPFVGVACGIRTSERLCSEGAVAVAAGLLEAAALVVEIVGGRVAA
jgi:phosphoglycolate phosphatase-like HAD superfamily hydrolase